MKYLKITATILLVILLVKLFLAGLPFTVFLPKGLESDLSLIIYFSIFSVLLVRASRTSSEIRILYILTLMFFFPCIYLEGLGYYAKDLYNTSNFIFSYYDLTTNEKTWFWNTGDLTLSRGIETHNALVLYQLYSIVFAVTFSSILLIVKATYKNTLPLYNEYKNFLLVCLALSSGYIFLLEREGEIIKYWRNTVIWYNTLSYLFLYFSLLILYLITFLFTRKFIKIRLNELIVIAFILFFPIISVSSDFFNTNFSADTVASNSRAMYITPLVISLPTTIKCIINDWFFNSNYEVFSVKLYSLFQIFVVTLVLPSLFTPKINKNG